jgi:hypothetical protein
VTASAVSPDPSLSRSQSGLVVTGLMAQPAEKTQPETSGRLKCKVVVVLNQCLCRETADPASLTSVVLECKQSGCETQWVSNLFIPWK